MNSGSKFRLMAVERLRMLTDGEGVTTLVAAMGCPLKCAYCLNDQCHNEGGIYVTPEELYEKVKIDNLYFLKTGGGITFGGGEPLMFAEFISDFRKLTEGWKIYAETCLNVPREKVAVASECIDTFIVDIKDMNGDIYEKYTGVSNDRVYENIKYLVNKAGEDRIIARIPLIPSYNTEADREKSIEILRKMGITRFDRFEYVTER